MASRVVPTSMQSRQLSAALLAPRCVHARPLSRPAGARGLRARPTAAPGGRWRHFLSCTARLTSSRDSLDEEQLEGLLALTPPNGSNGSKSAAAGAGAVDPCPQLQCDLGSQQARIVHECRDSWQARPLSIRDLQQLTQLHVEDAYQCGVVGCAPELAACLGSSLQDGLSESEASFAGLRPLHRY